MSIPSVNLPLNTCITASFLITFPKCSGIACTSTIYPVLESPSSRRIKPPYIPSLIVTLIEKVKSLAVELKINDLAKRQYILEKTGFNVTNAIIVNEETNKNDTSSSEESQQIEEIQQQPVVEETTTQPIEEATPVTENIEEENHGQWWTEEDYQYLLMIIVGEAQNCSRQEQMYVGSVVLNRLHSSWFPNQNTIKQVATAKGQYACMWDGNAYKTPTETNKEVALELLNNGSVLPENVVFQALFKQGNGVYCKINKTYFCYK